MTIMATQHQRQILYRFKKFLLDYGIYYEISRFYNLHLRAHIVQFHPSNFLLNVLGISNRLNLLKILGKKPFDFIKNLRMINDLWLYEIIYDNNLFSYKEKYAAISVFNFIHRFESEWITTKQHGQKVFYSRSLHISDEILKRK